MLFRMFHHTQDYSLFFVHNAVFVAEVVRMLFDLMDRVKEVDWTLSKRMAMDRLFE